MRFDSRTRKIVKQEEYWSNWQNPWSKWHQHIWTLLEKLTTWGQYSGPWEEKQAVCRSAGGNERWSNDESMHWGQRCLKKANQQDKHSDHYWGQCCSKIVHDLVNPDNNRESKDVPEGHLHIIIFWNMASDQWGYTNELNSERMHTTKTDGGTMVYLKDNFILSSPTWLTFERCHHIIAFEWMSERCTHQDWPWDHLF